MENRTINCSTLTVQYRPAYLYRAVTVVLSALNFGSGKLVGLGVVIGAVHLCSLFPHALADGRVVRQQNNAALQTHSKSTFTPVDYLLAGYDMRNLSKFYAPPGSAEKVARALLNLQKGSSSIVLTGFCVTERLVDGKKVPVAETDGPPGSSVLVNKPYNALIHTPPMSRSTAPMKT